MGCCIGLPFGQRSTVLRNVDSLVRRLDPGFCQSPAAARITAECAPSPNRFTTLVRSFVLRARSAPTDGRKLLASVGGEAHVEILAHTLMNAIFVAQARRADVTVHLVLESTADFSRTISFDSNALQDLGGFHEQALLGKVAQALEASRGMNKDETRPVAPGISVRTTGFEPLVAELAEQHSLAVMHRKGIPMREQAFEGNVCFVLTDHIPMPKKSLSILDRLGAKKVSLGSRMLFASQCIVLIHHELDQRECLSHLA